MLDHKLPYKILALVTIVAICLSALWNAAGFTMVVTAQSDRTRLKSAGK